MSEIPALYYITIPPESFVHKGPIHFLPPKGMEEKFRLKLPVQGGVQSFTVLSVIYHPHKPLMELHVVCEVEIDSREFSQSVDWEKV